jgi:hypothetical protein
MNVIAASTQTRRVANQDSALGSILQFKIVSAHLFRLDVGWKAYSIRGCEY